MKQNTDLCPNAGPDRKIWDLTCIRMRNLPDLLWKVSSQHLLDKEQRACQLSFHVIAAIFCQESVVHRHHVYKSVWTPFVGEIFDTKKEAGNSHNRHMVAVVRDSCVLGHLPRQYSRVPWYFLQHGGRSHVRLLAEDNTTILLVSV